MADLIDDREAWAADKAVNVAQAKALRAQADNGGLQFTAHLPPGLATWVLDRVADGTYRDPAEAVYAVFREYRDLEPHTDLRREIRARAVQAAAKEPRPPVSVPPVAADRRTVVPAVWQTIPLP